MSKKPETDNNADPNDSIVRALTQVLGLFGIEKSNDIDIVHQYSLNDRIGSIVYECINKKNNNDFTIVYFDFRKDKWSLDTHRFWCGFFERLRIGYYSGNNIKQLILQLTGLEMPGNSCKFTEWHFNFFKRISKYIMRVKADYPKKPDAIKHFVEKINNPEYSINKVQHDSESKDKRQGKERERKRKKKDTFLVTALRESVLLGFEAQSTDKKYDILIIDDRQFDEANGKLTEDVEELFDVCNSLSINCYILAKKKGFDNVIDDLLNEEDTKEYFEIIELVDDKPKIRHFDSNKNHIQSFMDFDYLLIDIWHSKKNTMEGLKRISDFQHKIELKVRNNVLSFKKEREEDTLEFQHKIKERVEKEVASYQGKITNAKILIFKLQQAVENEFALHSGEKQIKKNKSKIPEILAYTFLDDAETIQMAQRMGAAGYVHKGNPEGLPLSIVRAGLPLELKDATRMDYLSTNNFPCIASLPRQIIKHLFDAEISFPNADGRVEKTDDLMWIRSMPKTDNHVHFGTAIPLKWCYILSLISLYHWNNYWEKQGKESYKKYKDIITKITESISTIINNTLNDSEASEISLKPDGFRRRFLHFFSKEYKSAEVLFLKDVVKYLVKISDKLLTDNQIACLINVLIGSIVLDKKKWKKLYSKAYVRIRRLQRALKKNANDETKIHNLELFRDCKHLINNIQPPSSRVLISDEFIEIFVNYDYEEIDFDPLSEMLSTGKADNPYGLERYLASSCLVGSSLLQFADTVLLASMSIPEWAAAKKAKKNSDTDKTSKGNHEAEVTDNVIHLELRTTPQGFLNPYDFEKSNGTLATKLICVGLEFGIKKLFETPDAVTANLLISIKRDRDREDIIPCINTAVDLRDEYLNYIKDNKISEAEGFMIPHVSGLDVAGIERNNLPAELQPFYKEAFERCLLSTIHAGETESAQSVKDAIFMLNASRIGHGLSIQQDEELKRLISERRICVELCPKSNQFTNGFKIFREEAKGDKDNTRQKEYVYNNDDIRGKMLLSINTDNPTISHKASNCESFAYPLSEEFIWLSGMINREKQIPLSRLEVLSLIYNGFVSMFAPEQAKKSIISLADQEVLSILAAEYLDIGKD